MFGIYFQLLLVLKMLLEGIDSICFPYLIYYLKFPSAFPPYWDLLQEGMF